MSRLMDMFKPSQATVDLKALSRSQRAWRGFHEGMGFSLQGVWMFEAPMLAWQLGHAERGEFINTAATRVVGTASMAVLTSVVMAGLAVAVPGLGTGLAAGLIAGSIAGIPSTSIEGGISNSIRTFRDVGLKIRRLEMGGGFEETQTSYNTRYSALAEMSAALQPSRRYLGQEARFMHR